MSTISYIFNCQKFHNINDVYNLQIHNIHVVDKIFLTSMTHVYNFKVQLIPYPLIFN